MLMFGNGSNQRPVLIIWLPVFKGDDCRYEATWGTVLPKTYLIRVSDECWGVCNSHCPSSDYEDQSILGASDSVNRPDNVPHV